MNKQNIQDFFLEVENLVNSVDIIPRDLEINFTKNKIVSLIGPRRVGKTSLLLYLKKNFGGMYCDFEDPRLFNVSIRDCLNQYIELFGKPKFLFLDEVQVVDNWEKELRSLNNLKEYCIVVTGSSSKLLSKEISTCLRGRSIPYILLSLSFKEFLKFKNIKFKYVSSTEESLLKNELREYLNFGGYPEVVIEENSSLKIKILKEYFEDMYYKDFIERFNIKNFDLAKFLLMELLKNYSKDFSVNSFYNKCKSIGIAISKDYIYSLISKISETLNFYLVGKFSYKIHESLSWPKKVYICDTGLTKLFKHTQDIGKLMENCVFLELFRRKSTSVFSDIFYYKTKNNKEIDFIVKSFDELKLYEVCFELDKEHIDKVYKALNELNLKQGTIITWDYEETIKKDNKKIEVIPLWKWLLI